MARSFDPYAVSGFGAFSRELRRGAETASDINYRREQRRALEDAREAREAYAEGVKALDTSQLEEDYALSQEEGFTGPSVDIGDTFEAAYNRALSGIPDPALRAQFEQEYMNKVGQQAAGYLVSAMNALQTGGPNSGEQVAAALNEASKFLPSRMRTQYSFGTDEKGQPVGADGKPVEISDIAATYSMLRRDPGSAFQIAYQAQQDKADRRLKVREIEIAEKKVAAYDRYTEAIKKHYERMDIVDLVGEMSGLATSTGFPPLDSQDAARIDSQLNTAADEVDWPSQTLRNSTLPLAQNIMVMNGGHVGKTSATQSINDALEVYRRVHDEGLDDDLVEALDGILGPIDANRPEWVISETNDPAVYAVQTDDDRLVFLPHWGVGQPSTRAPADGALPGAAGPGGPQVVPTASPALQLKGQANVNPRGVGQQGAALDLRDVVGTDKPVVNPRALP